MWNRGRQPLSGAGVTVRDNIHQPGLSVALDIYYAGLPPNLLEHARIFTGEHVSLANKACGVPSLDLHAWAGPRATVLYGCQSVC